MPETFHRRGHHIQGAHGRRGEFAADGSHLSGGMIALMPTAADAKRLAFPGGEKAADLHCTLLFLGDDGSVWTEEQRSALEDAVRRLVAGVPPVNAKIFGVAHWNGDGDNQSWVWSVGDAPDNGLADADLMEARMLAATASTMTPDLPEIPQQHTPWVAHICAAYSGDLTVVRSLEKRLGPVTFDRIRLSFGDDDRDIPLSGTAVSLTAAGLRRDPHEHEAHVDYTGHTAQWTEAVRTAAGRLSTEMADWREQIHKQILAGADTPEELAGLTVETTEAADILSAVMHTLAKSAGDALVTEARKQGVEIPDWSLPDDTVTAAVGGQRLLRSVAQMTSDLLATNMVQSARRFVTGMLGRDTTPEALASAVDERLQEGQEQAVQGPIGTAMSAAQTAGREAVLQVAPPGDYYASEILDRNTCGPCKEVDGEQFGDLERAIKAYPVMGYKDCVGPKYGNACRGMIVARWIPESEESEPVTAAGGEQDFHGTKGQPGYDLLHGGSKLQPKSVLNEDQEMALREDLDKAFYAGFTPHEYNAYADPGSHDYDPDDAELGDDEVNYVEWEGLARYYASGADGTWFGDFEGSRRIRRAANELAGLDQTEHDRLLGEGGTSDYDRNAALGLLMGVATAPKLDRPLYRGSYYAGADPDEVEAQLRSTSSLDFSVVSFTDGEGVADYFADPEFYQANHPGGPATGTQVAYVVEPGAQGVLGHVFSRDMKAGDPGHEDEDEADYIDSDEALTDWTQERPREIVTGGSFEVGEITRAGDLITVQLRQTKTYQPKAAS